MNRSAVSETLALLYILIGFCYHFDADIVQEIASLQFYPIFT